MNATPTSTYTLSGLHCSSCVRRVTAALQAFAQDAKVTLDPMQVRLQGLHHGVTLEALQFAVRSVGAYDLDEIKLSPSIQSAQTAIDSVAFHDATPPSWLTTYHPLLLILVFILGSGILVQLGQHAGRGMGISAISAHETMRYFMAGFFLVFAFFKLLDLNAFADAYAGYDLLAARFRTWGLIYPFIELGLGIAYLVNFAPVATAWITVTVMGFSAMGVIRAVLDQRRIRCA
jgi:copper chaperone CopZ